MKNLKSEIRNPKQIRSSKSEMGDRMARSVLECGSPLPLSHGSEHPTADQSTRGLAQCKTWRRRLAVCFFILPSSFCICAQAQFTLDWFTVDGGGGAGTVGQYGLEGTVGQADAGGPLTNGQYSLTGGFWSLYAVQMPGAPLLTIALTSTNTALVWWPSPSTGFSLQQNTNLNTTNWVTPPETIHDDGTNSFIVVNPPPGVKTQRFYRLHKR